MIEISLLMEAEHKHFTYKTKNSLVKKNSQMSFHFLKKMEVKVFSILSNRSISLILVALYLQWKVATD